MLVDRYRSWPIKEGRYLQRSEAVFTSDERFYPNQIYGNVFTVTVTDGVEDIAGNPFQNEYMCSFTTGSSDDATGPTTSQMGDFLSYIEKIKGPRGRYVAAQQCIRPL